MAVRSKMLMMAALGTAVVLAVSGTAQAVSATVAVAGNTTVRFGEGTATDWEVNGVDHLEEISIWYQIGDGSEEQICAGASDWNIGSYSAAPVFLAWADQSCADSGLDFELSYLITGATPGTPVSDLQPGLTISNSGPREVTLRIIQRVNLDIGGDAAGDSASILNANTVAQSDGAVQVETSLVPMPDSRTIATGDVAWTLEWNETIGAGSTVIISGDMRMSALQMQGTVIPEPLTMVSVALCLGGIGQYVRRRRKAA